MATEPKKPSVPLGRDAPPRDGVRRIYRSTEITLGPAATRKDARAAVLAQARKAGMHPTPNTVHVEELMPPVTQDIVRHKGERIGMSAEKFRSRRSLAFRWHHTLHENEIVGTRWWGHVQVMT